ACRARPSGGACSGSLPGGTGRSRCVGDGRPTGGSGVGDSDRAAADVGQATGGTVAVGRDDRRGAAGRVRGRGERQRPTARRAPPGTPAGSERVGEATRCGLLTDATGCV